MTAFQELLSVPKSAGCIKIFCTKMIPEKFIPFHRAILQSKTPLDYCSISLDGCDLEDLFAKLSITFLGQSSLYAIKDADLTISERKKLDRFLKEYTGPHFIFFFTSQPQYEKNALILDGMITKEEFQVIVTNSNNVVAPLFIEKLFSLRSTYSFDESLTLVHYASLLGSRSDIFFSEWLDRILTDDVSLFTLSQYFFSQQKDMLSSEWERLKKRYPMEFWIAFFSEQLWQAALYLGYALIGKGPEVRRYTYRLPFSFSQKDWKKYNLNQLALAHELLYKIDHSLKNGCSHDNIDLFVYTALSL